MVGQWAGRVGAGLGCGSLVTFLADHGPCTACYLGPTHPEADTDRARVLLLHEVPVVDTVLVVRWCRVVGAVGGVEAGGGDGREVSCPMTETVGSAALGHRYSRCPHGFNHRV